MSRAAEIEAIAAFLARRGGTRCPEATRELLIAQAIRRTCEPPDYRRLNDAIRRGRRAKRRTPR